ncbi:MAG: hypothetical protein M1834_006356 [Cirrosporium novae-zelandiae]|nr:MAG: hypothetical protein M1834_006356 [Cirrosporium novae-zelandiae]
MLQLTAIAFTGFLCQFVAGTSSNYTIDTSEVSLSTRNSWCNAEYTSCDTLCGGSASTNTCDGSSLNYTCTCPNGESPDLAEYTDTMPYYICTEASNECVADNPNNATGQEDCRSYYSCGTKNVSDATYAASSSSSSASASATAASTTTASGSSATATATSTENAAVAHIAEKYSTGIVAAGLAAVFGLLL